jgi:hypothetical protein
MEQFPSPLKENIPVDGDLDDSSSGHPSELIAGD